MFDSSLVVQSAISSFNNAVLVSPTFFWSAVFMLPLFALVYFYGNKFLMELNLGNFDVAKYRTFNFALFTEIIILSWLIIMPGNYDVLRDSFSSLPYIVACLIFIMTASIVHKLRIVNPKMPAFWQRIKNNKYTAIVSFILLSVIIGFSGVHTFWGILMQASAFASGAIVGCRWNKELNPVKFTAVLIFVLTSIILMQPEFFRFGQLGNLTLIHLFFIILSGGLAVAIIALKNINSRGKIRANIFKKLKWMVRILIGISLILFLLTESVLIFLGLMFLLFVLFSMSIWHNSNNIPDILSKKLWALLLCSFGIITFLPVITSFGILYWIGLPKTDVVQKVKFLL